MKFGEKLQKLRKEKGMSQEELAARLHVSRQAVSKWENDPGLAIQKALSFGQLTRMKIDNMREEHHERVIQEAEKLAAQEKRQKPHISANDPSALR